MPVRIWRAAIVLRPKALDQRALPAEVGSTVPDPRYRDPSPLEHPTPQSVTVPSGDLRPLKPTNGSSL